MGVFPTKVLLAADGSGESERASRVAAELAGKTGSGLYLIHVWSVPLYYHPERHGYPARYESQRDEARRRLDELVERVRGAGGGVADARLGIGSPEREITETAEEIGAGLIVVGSRGLGGLRRSLLGSVSESVMRHAHCPVLVFRGELAGEAGTGRAETGGGDLFPARILVATDGSEDSGHAAEVAVELSRKTGSELHVVHVGIEYFLFTHDYISPDQYELLKEERREVLDRQVESIEKAGGVVAGTHLRMGRKVDAEVIDLAEELKAGFIVVGSRGQGRLARSLLGSASDSIVRHAHCPVLVVRKEKGGSPDHE